MGHGAVFCVVEYTCRESSNGLHFPIKVGCSSRQVLSITASSIKAAAEGSPSLAALGGL